MSSLQQLEERESSAPPGQDSRAGPGCECVPNLCAGFVGLRAGKLVPISENRLQWLKAVLDPGVGCGDNAGKSAF